MFLMAKSALVIPMKLDFRIDNNTSSNHIFLTFRVRVPVPSSSGDFRRVIIGSGIIIAVRRGKVPKPIFVFASPLSVAARPMRAIAKPSNMPQQRAEGSQRSGNDSDTRLNDGPQSDIGYAIKVVLWIVVGKEILQTDESGCTGTVQV